MSHTDSQTLIHFDEKLVVMSFSKLGSSSTFWLHIGCNGMDFPVIPCSDTTDSQYELFV